MKKLLALIMAIAMMLPFGVSIAEETINFDIKLPTEYSRGSLINYNNNIYFQDYSKLYILDKNTDELKTVADMISVEYEGEPARVGFLINDGDKLYAVTFGEECVAYSASIEGESLKLSNRIKLDTEHLENLAQSYTIDDEEVRYAPSPQVATIVDGKLYCLFNGDYQVTQNLMLISFDLETGESRQFESEFIFAICPYKDGKLLALTVDYDKLYSTDEYDNRPTLCVFSPQDDSLEEIGKLDKVMHGNMFGGMLYEEDRDALLYIDSYSVMRRFMDGTTEKCAHLPTENIWGGVNSIIFIESGRIAVVDESAIYVRSTDPEKLPEKSLTVFGYFDEELAKAAARRMPDVAINVLQDKWFSSAQDLGQALISGEDGIDVIVLSPTWIDFNSLLSKGYAEKLNASETIRQHMDRTYPVLKEPGMFEENIYAIPIWLELAPICYNPSAFEELGLTKPENFFDICDIMQNWHEDCADESEYLLDRNAMRYEQLLSIMLKTYLLNSLGNGEKIVLDTPLFREMAQRCESLRQIFDDMEEMPSFNDSQAMDEYFSRKALLGFDMYVSLENISQYIIQGSVYEDDEIDSWYAAEPIMPVCICAKNGLSKFMPIETTYALVNSQSNNKEIAIEYLENIIKSFNDIQQIELYLDNNEPIINEDYEKNISDMQLGLKKLEGTLAKAEGAEKTTTENNIETIKKYIERYEKSSKYKITEEAIKVYRELMDCAVLPEFSDSTLIMQGDLNNLLSRYYDGQLNLEQYIKEADSKLKLIELEGQ